MSKWYTYAEWAQVVRDLGVKQSMFNPNIRGPDDKHFMGRMLCHFEQCPSTTSGSLNAIFVLSECLILAPFYKVTSVLANLGEIEQQQAKGVRSMKILKRPGWERPHPGDQNVNVG